MSDRLVTVVGDTVDLYVETNEELGADVDVQFQSVPVKTGSNNPAPPANIQFTEKRIAVAAPLRDPPNARGLFAARIKWKVNLKNDATLALRTAALVAVVQGTSKQSGRRITAAIRDLLFVQAIEVTVDPKLTRIMLHEFAKAAGSSFVFDPAPVDAFVGGLSVEQRKLLCRIAEKKPAGRLVVFITFYDTAKKSLRMFADNGGGNNSIRPNATFTVFHCRSVEQGGVTLVCHTEHFAVHMLNGDTLKWIRGREGPKKQVANDYMKTTNAEPLEYKIAAHLPADAEGHDGVIWCSIYRPNGKSIMPGNFIHGIVNTLGCWMLFRNFNWPRSVALEFDRVYRIGRRSKFKSPQFLTALQGVADPSGARYDQETPPAGQIKSSVKFVRCDKNFAHLWFFHEIVGIKYFSPTIGFVGPFINDRNPHGFVFENTLADAVTKVPPPFNLPEEGSFAAYDPDNRRKADRRFRQNDTLWRDNALGFRTSAGFVPSFAREVSAGQLASRSWADVFFYREDDADLSPASPLVRSTAAFVPGT